MAIRIVYRSVMYGRKRAVYFGPNYVRDYKAYLDKVEKSGPVRVLTRDEIVALYGEEFAPHPKGPEIKPK